MQIGRHRGSRASRARRWDRRGAWHGRCSLEAVFEIQSMVIKELSASATAHAITALAVHAARRASAPDVKNHLRLCYLLPDEQGVQPFQGMRLDSYDAATGVLTVQACVPAHVVHDASRAGPYVLAVAADAIDAAHEFLLEQGATAFDAEPLRRWVEALKPQDLAPPAYQQVRNTDFDWS